jgi:hypothetical protein
MEIDSASTPSTNMDDGAQTLFAVSGRNQMELIAIADNKANMMAAICAALIFLIIALFSSGFSLKGSPILDRLEFVLPLGILLAFCCVSAICAILALKPKIIRTKVEGQSNLFFANYYRKSLVDYKKDMKEMLRSREMVYDHMLTDMYYNGLVLERKYALLGFSYTIFLLAIVCCVSAYVVATVI